jgi:hypothetical protein
MARGAGLLLLFSVTTEEMPESDWSEEDLLRGEAFQVLLLPEEETLPERRPEWRPHGDVTSTSYS